MTLIEALRSGKRHRVIGSGHAWLVAKNTDFFRYDEILADWEVQPEPRDFMLYKMHDGTIQASPGESFIFAFSTTKQPEFICRVREILG